MNYIQHLTAFYTKLSNDARLSPHHISLYSGIFQLWNAARFQNLVHINRSELMSLSRIGSVNTYIRCLKELHDWNYIQYFPSKNISVGSQIRVITFDNTADNTHETPLRHSNKHIKTNKNIPSQKEVDDYFKNEGYPGHEAAIFYSHYTAKGWMMGTSPIQNWQSAAINWMARAQNFNIKKVTAAASTAKTDKRSNNLNPNYNEPL